ncbi:EthD domain-containing protein [Rhexocercosporidium sp. MPI-PUGE-AT-0058]|nr:EthD domain-containing protein [Rhexocercosporidium sp. MPI-PUGE-AT-0058]
MSDFSEAEGLISLGSTQEKYLCLTICGYRKQGMSEEAYRNHMVNISAPMTKGLMVKYGVKRWTQIHNSSDTRALMSQLFDPQMCNLADYDCFSQVVFKSLDDYKRMKQDPWYKEHLIRDHENFADTKKSQMTIGWLEEFVRDGEVVDGFKHSSKGDPGVLKTLAFFGFFAICFLYSQII